jgi:hypothetical protein
MYLDILNGKKYKVEIGGPILPTSNFKFIKFPPPPPPHPPTLHLRVQNVKNLSQKFQTYNWIVWRWERESHLSIFSWRWGGGGGGGSGGGGWGDIKYSQQEGKKQERNTGKKPAVCCSQEEHIHCCQAPARFSSYFNEQKFGQFTIKFDSYRKNVIETFMLARN